MEWILFPLVGYLVGSIPFSYLLPKFKGVDVRKVGSGNIGGTNALRAAGPLIGWICMVLDGLKGFIPTFIVLHATGNMKLAAAVAIASVIGHDFPIYMKFKGGKGVASTVDVIFAVFWPAGFFFLGVWFLIVILTKIVSLASLIALFASGVFALLKGQDVALLILILATLSFLRHSGNVERLIKGQERKTDVLGFLKRRKSG